MNTEKWIHRFASDLTGKVVAVTGTTGGLGRKLCRYLAQLNAHILMLNRNAEKSLALKRELLSEFPNAEVEHIDLDLSNTQSVHEVCRRLSARKIDILILNAGVYNVPLTVGKSGYNNVFEVNFISHYCLVKQLLPALRETKGKVIAVGSVAHRFARLDEKDVDFSGRKSASRIYGNSKRFLMFSLYELLRGEPDVGLAVVHPGVTLTNMTNHYPKAINGLVKIGVKLLFPPPAQAVQSLLAGIYTDCSYFEWIGPRIFDVWGSPRRDKLHMRHPEKITAESGKIHALAEEIYAVVSLGNSTAGSQESAFRQDADRIESARRK